MIYVELAAALIVCAFIVRAEVRAQRRQRELDRRREAWLAIQREGQTP